MKDAVIRLFLISLAAILTLAIILFVLKLLGDHQSFTPFNHPILNKLKTNNFIISLKENTSNPVDDSPPNTINNIELLHLSTENSDWYIVDGFKLVKKEELARWLKQNNPKELAIFVHSRINLGQLVKLLLDENLNENVIVMAFEQKIIIELKKLSPRWLYVANPSQKMKIQLFDSIGIVSLANFDFDFYIYNPKNEAPLSQSIVKEMKKRHKIILNSDSKFTSLENYIKVN